MTSLVFVQTLGMHHFCVSKIVLLYTASPWNLEGEAASEPFSKCMQTNTKLSDHWEHLGVSALFPGLPCLSF